MAFQPSYSSFHYTQVSYTRYATPLSSPLSFPTPFASPFSQLSSLLPDATYTTYSLDSDKEDTGQYGNDAYVSLWANLSYSSSPPFTTTRTPTPVPSSELVFPPPLYYHVDSDNQSSNLKLPPDFVWGASSAAWQIEGALQLDGRGPAATDSTGAIQSNDNQSDANTATMAYFLYKEDIARLAAIGVPYFSFSISWTRIVPFGIADSPINIQGLEHYDDVINTCLEYGITPIVTLNHFDFPMRQLDNLTTLPENFLYYAKHVMTRYADRVPYWFTFNEPNVGVEYSFNGYNDLTSIMEAHSDVYHWYKDKLNGTGKISMKMENNLAIPLDAENKTHVAAARRYQDFILGIMNNPLFLARQVPEAVLSTTGVDFVPLTESHISKFNGTMDFWAFDPYVAQFAYPAPEEIEACAEDPSSAAWPYCVSTTPVQDDGWLAGHAGSAYSALAPQYVRQQLKYVWDTFRPAGGVMVCEFGFNPFGEAERAGDAQRFDLERTLYYQGFLGEMLKAVREDGVRVIGALAWSYVDVSFRRRFKRSFFDYVDFFQRHLGD
ncbi:uncharacterized protein APUU_70879S [Aspergillus puulaauensis]|uniref:Beta-glucosidase n=1 Tax=Aspergillus puulaauensis TaxID=1220207 RepID=A0A7R7XZ55_9EURO|nr:uncharacterized protein APUU_70879S [Aspergillus puulaauensis]BCS29309.1 hypothetical protein APUU_70879S [Aspergillus puulaauensis]